MIQYDEYIWGDRFKSDFQNNNRVVYSNIDHVKNSMNKNCSVVVTHNGDNPVDDDKISHFSNLKRWFGQNVMTTNDKVTPLPIGLENDYIGGQPQRKHILNGKSSENREASKLVYLNCSIGTYRPDRQPAYDYFSSKGWCTVKPHGSLDYYHYCNDILDHHFSICPRGNGLDCHRNWEILYLNRYPVMKKYYGLEKLYSDLPVVFVNDWSEVTEEFLRNKLETMRNTTYNMDKLRYSYWKKLIEDSI